MFLLLVCSRFSASSVSHTSCNQAASSGAGGGGGSAGGAGSVSGGSVPLYPPGANNDAGRQNSNSSAGREISGKQAKVLYDYDAADMKELSLIADEV